MSTLTNIQLYEWSTYIAKRRAILQNEIPFFLIAMLNDKVILWLNYAQLLY